jgi:uncharacterized protein YndB with AHSA1/START domain
MPGVTRMVSAVEISRPPEEVFAYVTDPSRFAEWQADAGAGRIEGDPDVGTRYVTTRWIAGTVPKKTTSEITEINPPKRWAARGVGGPVRETVRYTVEPLEDRARSRVRIELDFEGHGVGRLLVPLVVRPQARREMPVNLRALKERLEGRGKPTPS